MRPDVVARLRRVFRSPDLSARLDAHEARVAEAIARDRAGLAPLDYHDSVLTYVIAQHVERARREAQEEDQSGQ